MNLGKYAYRCRDIALELEESLSKDQVQNLHSALKGVSVLKWIKWRRENCEVIGSFVSETPSQRKKKTLKEDIPMLTLAGIQHCLEACELLEVVHHFEAFPAGSYRNMANVAGNTYQELMEATIPYWPFNEFETPFSDDPYREVSEIDK